MSPLKQIQRRLLKLEFRQQTKTQELIHSWKEFYCVENKQEQKGQLT
ncbi:20701_t:CDS:2 [Funneliformis geosporum]|uniref:19600_t:CDS:1 n=1 Tax=Funneliformis geosporum TaxID=1117311 RepID=A0A9W4WHH2_9GLOM|nr:20701_t:CDS:2 [Funneliformis geosporum]CAI2162113.1 19600_t:CDS:2 [Funneliformis geosporum]